MAKKDEGKSDLQPMGAPLESLARRPKKGSPPLDARLVPAVGRAEKRRAKEPTAVGWDWFDPLPPLKAATADPAEPSKPAAPAPAERVGHPTAPGLAWDFLDRKPRRRRKKSPASARILAAAVTEFAERGYFGGRMDRIAAGAECNKALIHYYFKDKAGLYRSVLLSVLKEALTGLSDILADDPPADVLLVRLVDALLDRGGPRSERLMMLRREILEGGERLAAVLAEAGADSVLTRLAEKLAPALKPGLDPRLLIAWLVGMCLTARLARPFLPASSLEDRSKFPALERSGILSLLKHGALA